MLRRTGLILLLPGCLVMVQAACTLSARAGGAAAADRMADEPAVAIAPFNAAQAKAHQATWSSQLDVAVETENSLGTKMVLIPPGEFQMGSSDKQVAAALQLAAEMNLDENTQNRIRDGERPRHRMMIARPFFLAATEVTIAQFRQFVKATGYRTQAEELGTGNSATKEKAAAGKENGFDWRSPGFSQRENAAVSQVTWNDAVAFCNWLSEQEDRPVSYRRDAANSWVLVPEARGYRLPTEAEWEYAARAGTTTQFYFGDDPRQLGEHAWYGSKSGSTPVREVGTKPANPFGLHDMHGNIGEWCQDFYELKSYPRHFVTSRPDPDPRLRRAVRGGDWWGNALRCRSAFRGYGDQITRSDDLGFRVARSE